MATALLHVMVVFASCSAVRCQTQAVCNTPAPLQWHLKQHSVQMNWTLRGNICSAADCWDPRGAEESSGQPFSFPQLCPLQLQHGDKLLMAADETLKSYGIKIVPVSEENFQSCSTNDQITEQLLLPRGVNETEQVDAGWLVPGRHYFVAVHEGDSQLCKLGLRLNVSVKTQLCQPSPLAPLCSGRGVCQTGHREAAYHCRCQQHHSGSFCEKFDACLDNPCKNKGVCLSNGSTDPDHRIYKCLCPPHFTGKDKTHWAHLLNPLKVKVLVRSENKLVFFCACLTCASTM